MVQQGINEGEAQLRVASVAGSSTVVTSRSRSPFRLLTPRSRGDAVWAYTSSFGGGMVAGDCTRLEVELDPGTRCFLGTQSSTKIYRNPFSRPCRHELNASLGSNALLVLIPDPVQCFADSTYEQRQHFDLASDAGLVLVDWMSAGRTARGERWTFRHYVSRNELVRNGRRILVDALRLNSADLALDARFRGGRFNCMATLVVLGDSLAAHATALLESMANQPITPGGDILFAISPLREGVLLRVAGVTVEQVSGLLRQKLEFIRGLLHDNPLNRKW